MYYLFLFWLAGVIMDEIHASPTALIIWKYFQPLLSSSGHVGADPFYDINSLACLAARRGHKSCVMNN